jgi:hypothetical protein
MIYSDVYTTSFAVDEIAVWLPSEKSEVTLWRAIRAGDWGCNAIWGRKQWIVSWHSPPQ